MRPILYYFFQAALPEDMRLEVIEEQRRLQSIRQRAAQNTEAGVTEVNPEFLAALPPNIQEELLTQQRIELQRQVRFSVIKYYLSTHSYNFSQSRPLLQTRKRQ